ncbi:hypothetical protein OG883_41910 [Streptomyces sp. NBC_01142]|uniref:hypothetical protein n=1 Tax=Streptomyces sp. NBC_01142 TaxID=2975865 RepID=UPI00224D320F|nr:hypothetical protein [Streptomyces sp. NBC_01142]MCX4826220.1 hypothetical protein [Streptomyces sp. NBC_01142]
MSDWFGWLMEVLGGNDEPSGANSAVPVGGLAGLYSLGMSHILAPVPGLVGQGLRIYYSSGINFDDPSELGEAMSMLATASANAVDADDRMPGSSVRSTRGEAQQIAAYGEAAIDESAGHISLVMGQMEQTTGIAESYGLGRHPITLGGDSDGGQEGVRRLSHLDLPGSPQTPDMGPIPAERGLLGSPAEPLLNSEQADWLRRTRPENATPPRPLGTTPPASKPEQARSSPRSVDDVPEVRVRGVSPMWGEGVEEVVIHGVRPPRPQQTPPRPENDPDIQDGRGFWDRGGLGLALGVATGAVGVVIIASNPVGWVVGLTGALMLASGAAATVNSGVGLGSSYAGKTTAEQDAATNQATSDVLGISSPGGFVGGLAGTVYSGDSGGFETGVSWGGAAEGAASLGTGVGGMLVREWRFGLPRNMKWSSARPRNQKVFGIADSVRHRPSPYFPGGVERVDLSHFIPHRPTKNPNTLPAKLRNKVGIARYERIVNRPFNLVPMWASEHALIDPERYKPTKFPFKLLYPPLTGAAQLSRLAPPWLLQTAYGGMRLWLYAGQDSLVDEEDVDLDAIDLQPPD